MEDDLKKTEDGLKIKWKKTSKKMENNLNIKMEDDLKKNENGRQPHFFWKIEDNLTFLHWKMTSIF